MASHFDMWNIITFQKYLSIKVNECEKMITII